MLGDSEWAQIRDKDLKVRVSPRTVAREGTDSLMSLGLARKSPGVARSLGLFVRDSSAYSFGLFVRVQFWPVRARTILACSCAYNSQTTNIQISHQTNKHVRMLW